MKPVEITVTCASKQEADAIARNVVGTHLAACSQTWPINSCYRWEGKVVEDTEHVLLFKTIDTHFDQICSIIGSIHSYELPSIVMIAIAKTGPGYMDWLLESTNPEPNRVKAGH